MSPHPTKGRDEPRAIDQTMAAVPPNRGRNAAALSADQERLLDEWVAGRLAPEDAVRAEALVKQNVLAAERVLERRLLQAAGKSPSVAKRITARRLDAGPLARAPALAKGWRSRGRWHWVGFAGAAALAAILIVAGLPLLKQAMRGGAPIQVATVAVGDRTPLLESSDIRTTGTDPSQDSPDRRFRDVEVPTILLGNLLAAAADPSRREASRKIEPYLPTAREDRGRTLHLVIDDALKHRVEADSGRQELPVRIYNLEDPRAADIRSVVGAVPDGARVYLLTSKP